MRIVGEDWGVSIIVEPIAVDPAKELAHLRQSGENWQVMLQGGRGGDVVMEVKRMRQLAAPRKKQTTRPTAR